MKSKITKRQHYVPQFYLNQFVGEDGYLHCYKKDGEKLFRARPYDVCFEDYGYEVKISFGNQKFLLPNEIENMFCSLEGEYSSVLKSVINKSLLNSNGTALICTLKEKEILASMVANFITRNFLAIDSFVDEETTQDLLKNNQEIRDIDFLLQEMNMGDVKPLLELAQKKIFLSPSEEGVTKSIVDFLLTMNLSFFATNKSSFITSDCPVGYNCTSEELLMARIPLSPNVMAVYSKSEASKQFRNRSRLIEDRFIVKLNQDYMNCGIAKTIIGKSQEDVALVLSKHN